MSFLSNLLGIDANRTMEALAADARSVLVLDARSDLIAYRQAYNDRCQALAAARPKGRFRNTPDAVEAGNEAAQTLGYRLQLSGEALASVRRLSRRLVDAGKIQQPLGTAANALISGFFSGAAGLLMGVVTAMQAKSKYDALRRSIIDESDETRSANLILERYAIVEDGSARLHGTQCWWSVYLDDDGSYTHHWHSLTKKPPGLNG